MKTVVLVLIALMLAMPVSAAIECSKSTAFNTGSTATIPAKPSSETIKVCAVTVSGDTASTGGNYGTTATIASNSVTKATLVPGVGDVSIGSGVGMLFEGEAGFSVVLTCGTGHCAGVITWQ